MTKRFKNMYNSSTSDEELGLKIIKELKLKIMKNGRVDLTNGDKTPVGLARTIVGMIKEHKMEKL